jgi:CheY-like chemotaxis protein
VPGKGSTFWATFVLEKAETLPQEVRQLPSNMSPVILISRNSSMRNMRAACLGSWGAEVSAAANEKEAQIYLKSHPTATTIISICSLPEYDIAAAKPILDFVIASIMQTRSWIMLCPINFVGKIRSLVAATAKSFAAKGETLAAHAALNIVVISKPVRQGTLYDCLMQIHATGVYRISRNSRHETATTAEFISKPDDGGV